MLPNGALWAPALARILDHLASLHRRQDDARDPVHAAAGRHEAARPSRLSTSPSIARRKASAASLLIVLIKPWGFNLNWQQLSYASLTMTALWIFDGDPGAPRLPQRVPAEPGLARHADERAAAQRGRPLDNRDARRRSLRTRIRARVVYAIDMLESLDKRNLVTPLLLYHESPDVRRERCRRLARVRRATSPRSGCPRSGACWATPTPVCERPPSSRSATINRKTPPTLARPLLADADSAHPGHGGGGARRQAPRPRTSTRAERDASRLSQPTRAIRLATPAATWPPASGTSRPALPPAARSRCSTTDAPEVARRSDGERAGGRQVGLHLRADARVAAAQPAAEGPGTRRARQLRRTGRRRARVLHARSRRGHLGPAAHPEHAGADSLAEVGGRAGRGVGRDGRLPPLQGRRGAGTAAPRTPRAAIPRAKLEALALRKARRYFNFLSLYDNLFGRKQLDADPAGQGLLAADDAPARSHLQAARAALSAAATSAPRSGRSTMATPRGRASASEYLDNILSGRSANASCRCSRTCRSTSASAAAT